MLSSLSMWSLSACISWRDLESNLALELQVGWLVGWLICNLIVLYYSSLTSFEVNQAWTTPILQGNLPAKDTYFKEIVSTIHSLYNLGYADLLQRV